MSEDRTRDRTRDRDKDVDAERDAYVDPAVIWLEPPPGADPDTGRCWCQHDVWTGRTDYAAADGPPTKYIRADIVAAAVRSAAEAMLAALRKVDQLPP